MTAGAVLSYLLQSSLFLAAGCVAFKLTLARIKMPAFNRCIIVAIYLVALTLPAIKQEPSAPATQAQSGIFSESAIPETLLSEPFPVITSDNQPLQPEPDELPESPSGIPGIAARLICAMAFAGIATALLRMLLAVGSIIRMRKQGCEIVCKGHIHIILLNSDSIPPFSLFNFIFISRSDFARGDSMIIDHELGHVTHLHSIDMFLSKLCLAAMWWNPAAWILHRELMAVHEFQADQNVIDRGHTIKDYQLLLIKKAAGARLPSVASSLNHSNLKKRFTMMYQKKPRRLAALRSLALVPAFCATVALTGQNSFASALYELEQFALFYSSDEAQPLKAADALTDYEGKVNKLTATEQIEIEADITDATGENINDSTSDESTAGTSAATETSDAAIKESTPEPIASIITESDNNGKSQTYVVINGETVEYSNLTPEQRKQVDDALRRADDAMERANESLSRANESLNKAGESLNSLTALNALERLDRLNALDSLQEIEAAQSARNRMESYTERQKESLQQQKESLQQQKLALRQQREELRKQRQELAKQRRQLRNNRAVESDNMTIYGSDDTTPADGLISASFRSLSNANNRTTVKIELLTTVKPTVGSAYLSLNDKHYNCQQPKISESVKINGTYHTTVTLTAKKATKFTPNKDYASIITNFGGIKVRIN